MKNLLFNERISSQLPTWRLVSVTFNLLLSVFRVLVHHAILFVLLILFTILLILLS